MLLLYIDFFIYKLNQSANYNELKIYLKFIIKKQ